MIPNWLMQRVYLTPNKIALSYEKESWTFKQLHQVSMRYARQLKTNQLQSGDRIALLGASNVEMVFMIHACLLAGIEIVMLNNRLTDLEIDWQIEDAEVKAVLFADEFEAKIKSNKMDKISFSTVTQSRESPFGIEENWSPDQTVTIMYTSGTTGFPKGVRQTVNNHTSSALSSVLNLGLEENDVWLCTMPLFHISGFSILVRSVLYGMEVRLYEKFDAKKVAREIYEGTITRMSVVSVMLNQILLELERQEKTAHASFKTMLAGGGSIPIDYLKRANACRIPILQTYGMTETSSQTATLSANDALRKIGSAGKPLFFNQIKIKGATRAKEHGEVFIRGPHVTPGYIGRFQENSPLIDGWLPTGDIGYLDEEGYLYIVDRRSDLIISGGENIYPAEIENVLAAHPKVHEVGVCGKEHPKWGQTPVAFVVVSEKVEAEELMKYCEGQLAKYKVPSDIIFIESLPRNASNKLLRRELKQWLSQQ
ncbi:o-succinylbenzoate--CoA ligase [Sporosarcina ureilytica]|uniref:2-succinylbenzoate--CoA ligase n=1 Tax=Sporosarcina ureilytica TaxID=298596 RepID=A0A1D8JEB0_9BACL|nr:o-succinylbenzoate--CoA ligase [Sporosarcina ureilytica]AOV07028.1 o-succinylbenzoate--CoA ligase [Sporosarcina ureilytica]